MGDNDVSVTLEGQAMKITGGSVIMSIGYPATRLIEQAEEAEKRNTPDDRRLAVLLAYAACDLQTPRVLSEICQQTGGDRFRLAIDAFLPTPCSLNREDVLDCYTALADDDPKTKPWWSAWKGNMKSVRHKVVHEGAEIDSGTVAATVQACRQYVEHLAAVLERFKPSS